jgi:serine/threonine-protein kinase
MKKSDSEHPAIDAGPLRYQPGEIIGSKYRLEELMGEGGMGSVWRARNLSLGVDVAVKLTHGELLDADVAERLELEAHAAAKLDHPAAVKVFDLGHTDLGDPFIVMELLRGRSLRDLLDEKEKLSPIVAVPLLLPIVSALVAAHAKGIVHRDLKPDNIVLVRDESGTEIPKVVDFGIAKVSGPEVDRRASTDSGSVMGSPAYMSPEQARGDSEQIDGRSDVWALAVVLYEMVTGRVPFEGKNHLALLRAIIEVEPVPINEIGVTDALLWKILSQGLAKDPAQRYPDMRAFGRALAKWSTTKNVQADAAGASIAAMWGEGPRGSIASGASFDRSSGPDSDPREDAPVYPPPRPKEEPPDRTLLFVAGGALALGVVVATTAYFASRSPASTSTASVAASTPVAAASSDHATTSRVATAHASSNGTTSPAGSPVASAVVSAAPTAAPPVELGACVRELFPADTFSSDSKLEALCKEFDPRRGATTLRGEVARVGLVARTTTQGMREFAVLSWYDMAVFAIARDKCCPANELAPLDLPPSLGSCPSLTDALETLGHAARDRKDLEAPLAKYREAVVCTVRGLSHNQSVASPYTYAGPPDGAADAALKKFIGRAAR